MMQPSQPTHISVSKKRSGFFGQYMGIGRKLERVAIPEDAAERNTLINGELKDEKTGLQSDLKGYKGKYLLLSLGVLAFIALILFTQLFVDHKKKDKDDNSADFGTDISSLGIALVGAILTYVVRARQSEAEQHLSEVKDSRKTLKGMAP